jgi:hypothetical protein
MIRGVRISNHPAIYFRFPNNSLEVGLQRDALISQIMQELVDTLMNSPILNDEDDDMDSLMLLREAGKASTGAWYR